MHLNGHHCQVVGVGGRSMGNHARHALCAMTMATIAWMRVRLRAGCCVPSHATSIDRHYDRVRGLPSSIDFPQIAGGPFSAGLDVNTRRIAVVAAVAVGLAAAGYWWDQDRQGGTATGGPLVRVVVPSSLTPIAEGA